MSIKTRVIENGTPVIFGEVLFDIFPNKKEVLGGAPFNVAWHLQGFGLKPLLISCIGSDTQGKQVIQKMQQWGMTVRGLQIDSSHPTGAVHIALNQGQPSFDIVADQAYDFIQFDRAITEILKQPVSFFYYGTLAARTPTSYATLQSLLEKTSPSIFTDINLRSPWWNKQLLTELLEGVRWLKLNEDELLILDKCLLNSCSELEVMAQILQQKFNLELLVVTLGESGAFIIDSNQKVMSCDLVPVKNPVDTVGAGDAFSAVTLFGLIQGWEYPLILQRAMAFAAKICQIQGATISSPDFYKEQLKQWNANE